MITRVYSGFAPWHCAFNFEIFKEDMDTDVQFVFATWVICLLFEMFQLYMITNVYSRYAP